MAFLHHKPPTYYYAKKSKSIICQTLRAASTSMGKAMSHAPKVSADQAINLRSQGVESVCWLRDPLDRWACAFHIFGPNRGWNLDQYVEWTFDWDNFHWMPQTSVHRSSKGIFVPTIVYPFEIINETWPQHARGYTLMHTKKSENRKHWVDLVEEMTPEQIERITNHYKADLDLREKIKDGNFRMDRQA